MCEEARFGQLIRPNTRGGLNSSVFVLLENRREQMKESKAAVRSSHNTALDYSSTTHLSTWSSRPAQYARQVIKNNNMVAVVWCCVQSGDSYLPTPALPGSLYLLTYYRSEITPTVLLIQSQYKYQPPTASLFHQKQSVHYLSRLQSVGTDHANIIVNL